MRYAVDAIYLDGYRLRMRFDDGSMKIVDLYPHLDGPICEPLRDMTYFKSFRVDHDIDTVVWENGADFAPEFLYEIGEDVGEQLPADGPSLRFGR
ncbi:MAG TPA: DUF2442 domain-containing protein [Candidatus Hydrogenedentes bacterium]|nr:DUF2442 domain-containing protein [Candidatus Latescibacterota bacterium]HQK77241.1 DUF2442 domain-containing protein [Candidatus Hydrogenedentota bacterium]